MNWKMNAKRRIPLPQLWPIFSSASATSKALLLKYQPTTLAWSILKLTVSVLRLCINSDFRAARASASTSPCRSSSSTSIASSPASSSPTSVACASAPARAPASAPASALASAPAPASASTSPCRSSSSTSIASSSRGTSASRWACCPLRNLTSFIIQALRPCTRSSVRVR